MFAYLEKDGEGVFFIYDFFFYLKFKRGWARGIIIVFLVFWTRLRGGGPMTKFKICSGLSKVI